MSAGNLKFFVALLASLPLTLLADESVDERWDINGDANISIENLAGEIIIQAWDKNEARLTGELSPSLRISGIMPQVETVIRLVVMSSPFGSISISRASRTF